jgi:phosphoglycerate dehydrogenase-like enzyme
VTTVLVIDPAAERWTERLGAAVPAARCLGARDEAESIGLAPEAEAIVALAHLVPGRVVAAAPRLKWIQALTTGTDRFDGMSELGDEVIITSARGVHGPQMSELAFLHMLALARRLPDMLANQRAARWERWPQPLLDGKTAVIVGVGAIAEELAPRCRAFGMRVVGVGSREDAPGFDAMFSYARLADAAAQADFLIVLVPLRADTRGLVDARVLAAMKPGAFLVNLARGGVVDEAALIEALRAGRIAGAGLDVFSTEPLPADSPIWALPNVIVTPHVGGLSDVYMEQVAPLVIENLRAFASGRLGDMRNVVRRAPSRGR